MNIKENYLNLCRRISAFTMAPTRSQMQICLFVVGVVLLSGGLCFDTIADQTGYGYIKYDDVRLSSATNIILQFIEGTFGAMIMVACGIMAIVSSAFGQYRAAIGLLVVAVGAFILRSIIGTFFNDMNIQG